VLRRRPSRRVPNTVKRRQFRRDNGNLTTAAAYLQLQGFQLHFRVNTGLPLLIELE
jgi:hypothetical protein